MNSPSLVARTRSLHAWLVRSEGATVPEYALLICLAISLALTGYQFLGQGTERAFGDVDSALGGNAVDRVSTPTLVARSPAPNVSPRPPVRLASKYLPAILAVVAATSLVLLRLCAFRRRGTPQPLEDAPAPTKGEIFERRQQILRILSGNLEALTEGSLEVQHVMTPMPTSIEPHRSVPAALSLMDSARVNYLVVANKLGQLQGLLSRHFLQKTTLSCVADVMAASPVYVSTTARLNPTITQMMNRGIAAVVVVDEGQKIQGLLTDIDVQLTLQCALQLLQNRTHQNDFVGAAR